MGKLEVETIARTGMVLKVLLREHTSFEQDPNQEANLPMATFQTNILNNYPMQMSPCLVCTFR